MKKIKVKKNNQNYFRKINNALFLLFIFLLPTQLGKHFFPDFSYLNGIRVDYLSIVVYLTDIVVIFLLLFNFKTVINFFKKKTLLFSLILILINVFFAKNQILASYKFIKIIEFLVVFSLGNIFLKILKEKHTLIVLLLTGGFQLILSILQMFNRHSFQGLFYYFGERLFTLSTPGIAKAAIGGVEFLRPYGTFSHPNSMAGFFLLLYFFVVTNKSFSKYLFLKYLSLFVFTILILISFSKVAIITFLFLNTFFWIQNSKIKCLPCKITRIIIPIIISLLFLQATTDPLTIDKRIELVNNSLVIIKNNLWLGVGLGNYLIIQSQISSKYPLFFNQPVHNIFLLFVSEMGILISAFFLFKLFFFLIKKNLLVFLAILITGFFDHYWLTLQQNFLLAALVYGSVSMAFFVDRFKSRS